MSNNMLQSSKHVRKWRHSRTSRVFKYTKRYKFENFCLFSLNSTYSIQNQVKYFQNVYNECVFSTFRFKQIATVTSLQHQKVRKDKILCRQDILRFFSGVSKDYKYYKIPKHETGTLIYKRRERILPLSDVVYFVDWLVELSHNNRNLRYIR